MLRIVMIGCLCVAGTASYGADDTAEKPAAAAEKAPVDKPKWTPPEHPDPDKILDEAQQDAWAGRYEQALEKHVWYHRNALKYNRALYGVRLSFALGYWVELGKDYPPAIEKLKEIRDEGEARVRKEKGLVRLFHDVSAINKVLDEDDRTVALFLSVDEKDGKSAAKYYHAAGPSLIRAKQYEVCCKYIEPDRDYDLQTSHYQHGLRLAEDARFGKEHLDYTRRSFSNGVETLVALLSLSDRKAEAEKIAADARKVFVDEKFSAALDKALEGKVPEPWP